MIDNLQKAPFFRILLPFTAGMVLDAAFPQIPGKWILPIILLFFPILFFAACRTGYYMELAAGVFFSLFFLLAGIFIAGERNRPVQWIQSEMHMATLLEKPVMKNKIYRAEALLTHVGKDDTILQTMEKLIVYFAVSDEASDLRPGSRIIFNRTPEDVKNQGNPYEFDYKNYLNRKGISRQVYLDQQVWRNQGTDPVFRISVAAERARDFLLDIYRRNGLSGYEFGILSALTLGYKKSMDPEIRQVFAATGAAHVLAVSGLHVGIIYVIFNLFFGFLKRKTITRYFFLCFSVSFLWLFAFITGLSPSVQRSALMFTVVLAGESLRRRINIYNTLAASAFILMAADPNLISDVGFQLSYAAVLGIVYFQPRISALFLFKSRGAGWLWGLFTVSVAAQITTFPLSCYYFHQFPVFFWMSNFIVIPAAFIFIFLGILILATSPLGGISGILAQAAGLLVKAVYFILHCIENIPGAVLSGFNFTFASMMISLMMLFFTVLFIESRKPRYLILLIGCSVIYFLAGAGLKIFQNNRKEIIAYKYNEPVVHLIYGRTNYLLAPGNVLENDFPEWETEAVSIQYHLESPVIIPFESDYADAIVIKQGEYVFFDGKIIGIDQGKNRWDKECIPEIIITAARTGRNVRYPQGALIISYARHDADFAGGQKIHLIREKGAFRTQSHRKGR